MNEGLQDGIGDCGDGAGTGAGTGVETRRRTPDANGDGNGDGSEDSSGDWNGDKDNRNGNEDRIGGGGIETKKRKKLQTSCRRHVGNGRDLGGKRESCRNERFGLLLPLITILPVVTKDPSLPGSRLTTFYRDVSSALLQLVNQWLKFTYSRSHAFCYERKNTNPTW